MPLFACTRCRSRHPFEELSEGEQLCKDCRSNYPIVKCTYCRAEFQQEDKTSTNSVCKKCAHNVKQHGKPSACEYCNVIAAFIGNKCQRCTNSEKKWGPPHTCEQCKQQCAFDRRDETTKRVDGKFLCWLCTMTYKRVMAKTKAKGGDGHQSGKESHRHDKQHSNHHSSHQGKTQRHHKLEKGKEHHRKDRKDHHRSKTKEDSQTPEGKKHKNNDSSDKDKSKDGGSEGSSAKKQKLDKSSSNGLGMSKSESFNDFGSTENMVMITQLREEVESLKRALSAKDQQILERDRKVTELKAQNFEAEKEMRNKLQTMSKTHSESVENFQSKIRDLTRQVSTLSRKEKKSGVTAATFNNSPSS